MIGFNPTPKVLSLKLERVVDAIERGFPCCRGRVSRMTWRRHERFLLPTHLVRDQCQRVTNSSAPLSCKRQDSPSFPSPAAQTKVEVDSDTRGFVPATATVARRGCLAFFPCFVPSHWLYPRTGALRQLGDNITFYGAMMLLCLRMVWLYFLVCQ